MGRVVLGLDLAAYKTGWCIGDGSGPPTAGAWLFPNFGGDLGALAEAFEAQMENVFVYHKPEGALYESPLLMRHDRLLTLRRTYGLGMEAERICRAHGAPCKEDDPKALKAALTGDPYASKPDMVKAARALGITLPRTIDEGQQDAADAVAAWVIALRTWGDPEAVTEWDRRLGVASGALL